ncbi:YqzM family protein [Paenibacillus sp. FSL R7-0345]|uniref:YqzM family protein n=1 Tax=Paenibacillus sp. FSL R7-0345 TaxID=2954535 RepID=UPI003159EACD
MEINAKAGDPREHVNEEPRNDLGDLMTGFFGMTGFMTLVFFGMVIVKFVFMD